MLYKCIDGDRCLLDDFLCDDLENVQRLKVEAFLKSIGDNGMTRNQRKSRKLRDRVFEFKIGAARIPYFYDGEGGIVLTHGFAKGAPLTVETRRAIGIRDRLLADQGETR